MSNITKMPHTKEVKLGSVVLQCRLDGMAVLKIEQRLDESVMGLFMKNEGEMKLPPISKMLIILHASNVKHGVKEKDVLDGFMQHMNQGGTTMDIITIVQELLEEAGFFGKQEDNPTTDETEQEVVTLDAPQEVDSDL